LFKLSNKLLPFCISIIICVSTVSTTVLVELYLTETKVELKWTTYMLLFDGLNLIEIGYLPTSMASMTVLVELSENKIFN
jgi:hypothetical protein